MTKCIGCGITLQNTNLKAPGYTKDLNNDYCERCFKTIHYNQEIKIDNINNEQIINKINKLKYFTIFITDLFCLNNNVINNYHKIKNNKIFILNKCDLIPNNLKLEHLEENIKKIYNINEDVFFISAKNKMYLNNIEEIINNYKKVIFCGESSSGKSTLINNLMNTLLTTSKYQNTTLDFIKLKKDNIIIYDTPGLLINNVKTIEKIGVYTKRLNGEYTLLIDDIKIKGTGNITIFLDKKREIISKKDNLVLNEEFNIYKPTDILIPGGFIFIKNGLIRTNKKLEIRNSIIK